MSFTIEEAKQVLSQKFLLQEGVAGVSHHSSEIVVYVESEEYAERIPRTLLGYPVKVVVSGRFRILAGYEARTARVRPVVGGVSAGSTLTTAGTVACTVVDRLTGLRMLLSNRHVFDGPAGTPILQPGAVDGGVYPDDVVAAVERFIEVKPPPDINLVDACVAMPVSQDIVGYEVLGLGVPNGVGEARVGERIRKSGRSCGVSEAVVVDTNATVKVEGYCFTEDTLILTTEGPKTVNELKPGDLVYSYNLEQNKLEKSRVNNIIYSGEKEVFLVKTRERSVKVSEDHPFLVVEINERLEKVKNQYGEYQRMVITPALVWKKLKDIKVGDWIVVLRKAPLNRKENDNLDFFRLTGFFIGDGGITIIPGKSARIDLYGTNKELLVKYGKILEDFSGEKLSSEKAKSPFTQRAL